MDLFIYLFIYLFESKNKEKAISVTSNLKDGDKAPNPMA